MKKNVGMVPKMFFQKAAPGRPKTGLRPPSAASAGAARDQGVEAEVSNLNTSKQHLCQYLGEYPTEAIMHELLARHHF